MPTSFHITSAVSVYVISRVQIAFHTTRLYTSDIKHFHIAHSITSHHFSRHTIPHHATIVHSTYHTTCTYMFHATSGRHLMSQHISPRTTIFYIWHHITPQSASHHRFTPPHLKAQHIRHRIATVHIAPFRIHNDCTPHPHSTSQYISHHISHIPHHMPPHLTSIAARCIFFHI